MLQDNKQIILEKKSKVNKKLLEHSIYSSKQLLMSIYIPTITFLTNLQIVSINK